VKKRAPHVAALLDRGRIYRRVPATVRARVLARAGGLAPEESLQTATPVSSAGGRGLRLAVAASACLVAGGGFAAAAIWAYRSGPKSAPVTGPLLTPPPAPPASPVPEASSPVAPSTAPLPTHPALQRPAVIKESYAAELELLKHAQAAYGRGELVGALAALAEHARRFPLGRLTEEREALRVRSLQDLGRTVEAERAARAFASRFRRSALLPRVLEALGSAESRSD